MSDELTVYTRQQADEVTALRSKYEVLEKECKRLREQEQSNDTLIDSLKDAMGDDLLRAHVDRTIGFVPEDLVRAVKALREENARRDEPRQETQSRQRHDRQDSAASGRLDC